MSVSELVLQEIFLDEEHGDESLTVGELLQKLNLEKDVFMVLVNGVRADIDMIVGPEDKIIVLPRLVGG